MKIRKSKANACIIFKDIIKIIFKFRIFRILIVPSFLIAIISSFLENFQASCVKKLIDTLNQGEKFIISFQIFFIVSMSNILIGKLNTFIFAHPCQLIYKECMIEGLEKYLKREWFAFYKNNSGNIHSVLERRSDSTGAIVTAFFTKLISLPFSIFFNLYFLVFHYDKEIYLIISVHLFIYITIALYLAERRKYFKILLNKKYNEAYDLQLECFYNYEVIKAYNNEEYECRRYERYANNTMKPAGNIKGLFGLSETCQNFIFFSLNSFVLYHIFRNIGNKYTVGYFAQFIAFSRILKIKLSELFLNYGISLIDYANIYEYYKMEEENEETFYEGQQRNEEFVFNNEIIFKNVCVEVKNFLILKNINLNINKGEKIALIGINGSGKTTFIRVLLGFYEYSGNIKIDGIELKEISKFTLRNNISFVPQESCLINETIEENICYGGSFSQELIYDTSKKYSISDSLEKLKNSFPKKIGEKGKHLSGGEKQTLAFLRGTIRSKEILILDEPTSAIDTFKEKIIFTKLLEEKNVTLFCVIHNTSLLNMFDKILYFSKNTVKSFDSEKSFFELVMQEKSDNFIFN